MTGFPPDLATATVRPSPNFGERKCGAAPTLLILHYTGMETGQGAEDWLCREPSQVSSHYLVHEDGRVMQMVREADRAWHAGQGSWKGHGDINSRSIGIEIVNGGHAFGLPDFPEAQIEATIALCRDICQRNTIRPEAVLAHSDTAPGRKVDPGEKFPWRRLAEAGIGLYPALECAPVVEHNTAAVQSLLTAWGYGLSISGVCDEPTHIAITAFQRHFRPERIDGIADGDTVGRLVNLLAQVQSACTA